MYFSVSRIAVLALLLLLPFTLFHCAMGETEQEKEARLEAEKERAKLEAQRQVRLTYLREQRQWVDSLLLTMTPRERIGQLFMVAAYSNKTEKHVKEIETLIREYHIGGLIFFQGGPGRQAILTNRYQSQSKVPLLVSMDLEWGLGMRLDSTISFPKQMTLGAIQDNRHIYDMGAEIARQCQRLGVHVNFAPVIDVNNNPANPVIGYRSFGEDKHNVAAKGTAYMKGMQDNRIIANGKHFPGHGDTDTDSHLALPIIQHDKQRLFETELYPFQQLMKDSLMSLMVAHLHIPALDSQMNVPTTLSKKVVTDLLIDSLGFEGLIFTDAMNMQGVAKNFGPGEMDVLALEAGNDVLLYPMDVQKGVEAIEKAIQDSVFTQEYLDRKVRKILNAKFFANLHRYEPIVVDNILADLNSPEAYAINERLFEKAVTVVKNDSSLLPVTKLDSVSFASVAIGTGEGNRFDEFLKKYAPFEQYHVAKSWAKGSAAFDKIHEAVKNKDLVVVSVQGLSNSTKKNFGVTQSTVSFLEKLQKKTNVIVAVFGNAYSLKNFTNIQHLICAYEGNGMAQKAVAQAIFGALKVDGKLPVSIADNAFPLGSGYDLASLGRLGYAIPESVGMSSRILKKLGEVAEEAVLEDATPGCQVLVAKDGRIVYQQNYGFHSYSNEIPVHNESMYDIASLTKVIGSLPALMTLRDQKKLEVGHTVADLLPETATTNKGNLKLVDILTHQAGLRSFIKHWDSVMVDGDRYVRDFLRTSPEKGFSVEVAPGIYAVDDIEEWMWKWTLNSKLIDRKTRYGTYRYWYSDVGYYIFQQIIERHAGMPLESFLDKEFYRPMGLQHLTYHPLQKIEKENIVPTEMDIYYRKQLIHGTVHDPGAALLGGGAGHAGLFSNVHDLAVMMQMYLQGGEYGGKRYLFEETVNEFNTQPYLKYKNRRALGWDKPDPDKKRGFTSKHASSQTFGHTGFTGTCAWVDPVYNLVYIFLSNRVHPYAGNKQLIRGDIRERIQDVIYHAMGVGLGTLDMRHYK